MRPPAAPESDDGEGAPARDRGASRPSGALTQMPSTAPNPQIAPRAPRSAREPLTLRPTPAAALLQPGRAGCRGGVEARAVGAAGGIGTCSTRSGRSRRSDRTVGTPAPPRQVASAGAGAVLSPPAARCRRPRVGRAGAGSRRHRRPRGRRHLPRRHQLSARLAARGRSVRRSLRPAP